MGLEAVQAFIDQHIFPPSGPEYSAPANETPQPPSYGAQRSQYDGPTPTLISPGNTHTFDPQSGIVAPAPPEPEDRTPGAEPTPHFDKKAMKALAPYTDRIMELAGRYGRDHMIAPDTQEMHDALGTGAKALGLENHWQYNIPGLGHLARGLNPKAQSVLATQDAASRAYAMALDARLATMSGPQTAGDAARLAPGVLPPQSTEAQRGSLAPDQGGLQPNEQGPQPGIVDPRRLLSLQEKMQIQPYLAGVQGGHTTVTPEGIEPASVVAMQERKISVPAQVQYVKQLVAGGQITAEQGQAEIAAISHPQAASSLNTLRNQQGMEQQRQKQIPLAQAHYLAGKDIRATMAAYPMVKNEEIRAVDKEMNPALVKINMDPYDAKKEYVKSSRTTFDALKGADAQIANLDATHALIDKAKGFMGPGGETLLEAAKFLNNRLGTSIDTQGVKSAEELRSRIFFNIMDNLKKMDAQPSQMQQIMMMDALGKLGTDPNALHDVLNAYEDNIRNKVDSYNHEVRSAMDRKVEFPYDPEVRIRPRKQSVAEPQYPTATNKDGHTLIYKDGTWQPKP